MQKQKKASDDPFDQAQEEIKIKPLSIQLPDIHGTMRALGRKDLPRTRGTRVLCCCGVPGCGIGPMTRTETEE